MGLAALVLAGACRPEPLPEFGNVLVQVDTDAPVPGLVTRLRVDVFDGERWISSRGFTVRAPGDWPASFVLYHPGEATRTSLVRLRAYADGTERDYLGERYLPPPSPSEADDAIPAEPERTLEPRLFEDGEDRTPADEPSPNLTIDRLLRVETRYGQSTAVRVVLRGDCFGVMADLAGRRTCVDGARPWESADEVPSEAATSAPSLVGSFPLVDVASEESPTPDGGGEVHDDEILVPGGVFVLGSRLLSEADNGEATRVSASPERVAVVQPFLVDRYEVTVARYRLALARGFVPSALPYANDGPMIKPTRDDASQTCTFSREPRPGAERREDYPVNCISHAQAREFCRFGHGDLLTEVEWEYVAMMAGRSAKAPYPWGFAAPTCDVITSRGGNIANSGCAFSPPSFGPARATASELDETPLGVHGLFGNLAEWLVDAPLSYASAAYRRAPLDAQQYDAPDAERFVVRGQSWGLGPRNTTSSARASESAKVRSPTIGFRCARPAR